MQDSRKAKKQQPPEVLFGQILKECRQEKGLTQELLAFESGYHPTYIGQLERGKKSPSLRTLLALAKVLGTRASRLLTKLEDDAQLDSTH